MLWHFYHIYADGNYQPAVEEHILALQQYEMLSHLDGFFIGLVGTPENRQAAVDLINSHGVYPQIRAAADNGWEHVTLEALRKHSAVHDGNVLYAHTKSAYNATEINIAWRKSMCYYNVVQWRQNLLALQDHDTSGCHFIDDREQHGGLGHRFYGGTYWWARNAHIRRLPDLIYHSRWCAEWWIGERFDDWKHYDTNPGWPDFPLFRTEW